MRARLASSTATLSQAPAFPRLLSALELVLTALDRAAILRCSGSTPGLFSAACRFSGLWGGGVVAKHGQYHNHGCNIRVVRDPVLHRGLGVFSRFHGGFGCRHHFGYRRRLLILLGLSLAMILRRGWLSGLGRDG